jgi:hypothetical protein
MHWKKIAVHKRVIVNTNEHAFSGILYKQAGPLLVLRDAQLLEPGLPPTPVHGEVVIERSRVEFIQVVS